MSKIKVVTVVGARPQFVKAAAVTRIIKTLVSIEEVMIHTGQHFDADMSDVFFAELEMPKPSYHLGIHGGGHGDMTGKMLSSIEPILAVEKPDWVVVYGDTNSTLAGALAAAKLNQRVAHVEAGLRSFNRRMPEEINRVIADHVSSLQFCPTIAAVENLAREGITKGVYHVGDVMFDATRHAGSRARVHSHILERLGVSYKSYTLATVHRAENTDDPMTLERVFEFLREQGAMHPVILPLHPRTRNAVAAANVSLERISVIDPIGYIDMHRLLSGALAVFTDSGGLQKEAYFHRVPCVTLRSETEWVETVTHGWNRLWNGPPYRARKEIPDYGTGRTAEAIVEKLIGGAP